eukprot:COSAG06_NODE_360_length_16832_cov_9.250209_23_plen_80_part_00
MTASRPATQSARAGLEDASYYCGFNVEKCDGHNVTEGVDLASVGRTPLFMFTCMHPGMLRLSWLRRGSSSAHLWEPGIM